MEHNDQLRIDVKSVPGIRVYRRSLGSLGHAKAVVNSGAIMRIGVFGVPKVYFSGCRSAPNQRPDKIVKERVGDTT